VNAQASEIVTQATLQAGAAARRPRTLVIGSHCFTDSMESHVLDALRELGCTAEFFAARAIGGIETSLQKAMQKAANLLLREPERLVERRLFATIERLQPELILVILGSQLSPKTVQLLRARSQAPIVCWCQDSMTTLGRQYLLGAQYDAVFVKDRYMQSEFSRVFRATPFHYLPEACNPRVHRALQLDSAEQARLGCDVMIAGSLYYYRQEIIAALRAFNVKIYGHRPSWFLDRLPGLHVGREVYGEDKVRAVRAARIALNTLHYSEINGLNCRAFELAGCGAFQIVSARPVLAEHFRIGEEIETFENIDELVEKVRFYLRNPERARRIGDAGGRRAHTEHTFTHRLESLLGTVFTRQRQAAP
jgi:spore maturation protein CgeB